MLKISSYYIFVKKKIKFGSKKLHHQENSGFWKCKISNWEFNYLRDRQTVLLCWSCQGTYSYRIILVCIQYRQTPKGPQNPEVEKTGKKNKREEKEKEKGGFKQSLGLNKQKKRGGTKKEKEKREKKKKQAIGASCSNTGFDRLPIVAFFFPFLAKFSQLGVLVSKWLLKNKF